MSAHDKAHRDWVLELMKQGKLRSCDGYYYAAMIMQHGIYPKDLMLAQFFAMAAAH